MCFLALAVLAILLTLPLAESHGPESARIGGRDGERMAVLSTTPTTGAPGPTRPRACAGLR